MVQARNDGHTTRPRVVLKPGKEKPVLNRHPWVFSGAVAHIGGTTDPGAPGSSAAKPAPAAPDLVDVYDAHGRWLACGYLNRRSQIIVRLLSWQAGEAIDDDFWRRRLQRAIAGREALARSRHTNAYRLVNAENDGLPGLVVDRYADWIVVQCLTLGIARRRDTIVQALQDLTAPAGIFERSDVDVRSHEGLPAETGVLAGAAPPPVVWVQENGHTFAVNLASGQKTGFYLDQRDNRARTAAALATMPGARVLNCFAYSGAFAVYASTDGAADHVTNLDSSLDALELAEQNLAHNGIDPDARAEGLLGDVFTVLRDLRTGRQSYDAVILDPPKFAHSQGQLLAATRGYKDINLLAAQLVRPGGLLITFSCSGLVSADLFQKVVFGAGIDARRELQVLARLGHGSDHPILLSFPEGEYLKGLICRVW